MIKLKNILLEVNPAGVTATAEVRKQFENFKTDVVTEIKKYITNSVKLPGVTITDGNKTIPVTVKDVDIIGNESNKGIWIRVFWTIKGNNTENLDHVLYFSIYPNKPGDLAGYYGKSDQNQAKTTFNIDFLNKMKKSNASPGGPEYDKTRDAIWNGVLAATNIFNKNLDNVSEYYRLIH
jgi:hypothetical protein